MNGAIPPLPQYAFLVWCSVKAQRQLPSPFYSPQSLEFVCVCVCVCVCGVPLEAASFVEMDLAERYVPHVFSLSVCKVLKDGHLSQTQRLPPTYAVSRHQKASQTNHVWGQGVQEIFPPPLHPQCDLASFPIPVQQFAVSRIFFFFSVCCQDFED
jgi:hypothetical protein